MLQKSLGGVFVYDVSDRHSFESIGLYAEKFRKYSDATAIALLMANKVDDLNQKPMQVSPEEGQEMADRISAKFVEVSAHSGENVLESINWLLMTLNDNFIGTCLIADASDAESIKSTYSTD